MTTRTLIATVIVSVAIASCGDGGSGDPTASAERNPEPAQVSGERDGGFPIMANSDDPRFGTITTGKGRRVELEIDPADRPEPTALLAKDITVGTGPAASLGDRVLLYYKGADYKTGAVRFNTWTAGHPYHLEIRAPKFSQIWEKAVFGMREGGRREVLIPSRLLFGEGALDYVFDVVRVEPPAAAPSGG